MNPSADNDAFVSAMPSRSGVGPDAIQAGRQRDSIDGQTDYGPPMDWFKLVSAVLLVLGGVFGFVLLVAYVLP